MTGPARALLGLAMVSAPGAWLATINVRAVAGVKIHWWVEVAAGLMIAAGIVGIFRG